MTLINFKGNGYKELPRKLEEIAYEWIYQIFRGKIQLRNHKTRIKKILQADLFLTDKSEWMLNTCRIYLKKAPDN